MSARRVAVIGAGWAGLAAAVRATQAGHAVTVFEAAAMPGGRARSDRAGDAEALDNGQHILLGGYARTLALMGAVGVDPDAALLRSPLALRYPDGRGFALSARGPRWWAAGRALASARGFSALDKLSILALAADWGRRGFRCTPTLTVAALLRRLPTARVRRALLEPLCIAALNTPVAEASAAVFLTVMRDSLFGPRPASDLLLPRQPLAQVLPAPAVAWLRAQGATVHLRRRVRSLQRAGDVWLLHLAADTDADTKAGVEPAAAGERFERVIVATPASEAARLCAPVAAAWAATAAALAHEPIVTLVFLAPVRPWPAAMLALDSDDARQPAQFAFKLATPGADGDRVTLVISAAASWLARGTDALVAACAAQYRAAFDIAPHEAVRCLSVRADRRATFRCVAGVVRPPRDIAAGLMAAGDYVEGPYPATLEAAVLAGEAAAGELA